MSIFPPDCIRPFYNFLVEANPVHEFFSKHRLVAHQPACFSLDPQSGQVMVPSQILVPAAPLFKAELENAVVVGGSRYIWSPDHQQLVLSDFEFAQFSRGVYSDGHLLRLDIQRGVMHVGPKPAPPINLECAIFLLNHETAAANYFHFVFEVITRLSYLSIEEKRRTSVLVSRHSLEVKQFSQVLHYFGIDQSNIIPVTNGQIIKVKKLIYAPSLISCPIDLAPANYLCASDCLVFPEIEQFFKSNTLKSDMPKIDILFLYRRNGGSRLKNQQEIIDAISRFGPTVVDPTDYSFEEQAKFFKSARIIIGEAGSAFTNMVFCEAGAVALILSATFPPGMTSSLFSTIAFRAGITAVLIQGTNLNRPDDPYNINVHIPYLIEPKSVVQFLDICFANNAPRPG